MYLEFWVPKEYDGFKAVDILKEHKNVSSTLAKKIRLYGDLLVNGVHARMIDSVFQDDHIVAYFDHSDNLSKIRQDSGIHTYYQDDWIIVCEKPGNLVTHPSWQHMNDSLIQRLSEHKLHPVMRLDRETSGLIVVALDGYSHHLLNQQNMQKEYLAVIHGLFNPPSSIIHLPIDRAEHSIMIREVRPDGKEAITEYETIQYWPNKDLSLVKFRLHTGRCHQIRVHTRHLGHPIVGDGLYGICSNDYPVPNHTNIDREKKISRQALHAYKLAFCHPITGEKLNFVSPLPKDMLKLIQE